MTTLKQSASKDDFVRALGLNMDNKDDKDRFTQMWDEVTTYWEKHFETTSRSILRPEYAANEAVRQPYKWAHLAPSVIDSAIHAIHTQAAPWPRQFYDMGRSTDQRIVNWVLKWLLWHVCRYRDWRNRKNRRDNQDASFHLPAGSTSYAPAMAPSPNLNPAIDRVQISPPGPQPIFGKLFLIDGEVFIDGEGRWCW